MLSTGATEAIDHVVAERKEEFLRELGTVLAEKGRVIPREILTQYIFFGWKFEAGVISFFPETEMVDDAETPVPAGFHDHIEVVTFLDGILDPASELLANKDDLVDPRLVVPPVPFLSKTHQIGDKLMLAEEAAEWLASEIVKFCVAGHKELLNSKLDVSRDDQGFPDELYASVLKECGQQSEKDPYQAALDIVSGTPPPSILRSPGGPSERAPEEGERCEQ